MTQTVGDFLVERLHTWGVRRMFGTEPSYELTMECDTLLMIGSGFPYSEFLPPEGQARGVQIDIAN